MSARALDIGVVGGGPGGLYFAVLAKQANPRHRVRLRERNRRGDTFGFGVVFSENTMGFLTEQDRRSYPAIMAASRRWDPFTVIHRGEVVRCGGVGFSAIARRRLLEILQTQAAERGVELQFEAPLADLAAFDGCDLVVLADGVNSAHRSALGDRLGTVVEEGPTRFTWLGTTKAFDSLTFFFERSVDGAFGVHVYPYADDRSTFIVETDEATWRRAGMDRLGEEDTIAYLEALFARQLEGHRLLSNRSAWARFRTVRNRRWHTGNRVLIGDAAHTAHFSVGSGTKMAMEDGLALAQQLERAGGDVGAALQAFEDERRPRVEHIQRMAAASFDWWSTFDRYLDWRPRRFTFHFLTRSQFRYDTLRDGDPGFVRSVEEESGGDSVPARTVGAGERDEPASLHLLGVAAVSPDGRLSPADRAVDDWSELLAAARRRWPGRKLGLQLRHAGPRGACHDPERGADDPLPGDRSWPLVAASAVAYGPGFPLPRELDEDGMREVAWSFGAAAGRAAALGVDWLELQFGHGYLLASFLSPGTNRRGDGFGGAVERRLRFPLQVLRAVRRTWPRERLLAVACNAEGGTSAGAAWADTATVARELRTAGADVLTILSGHTTWKDVPAYGRVSGMLAAGRLRNEHGIPTMCAGGVTDLDDARTVLLSGRADYARLDRVGRAR
ncbi:MAG: FAD-dependent monooxygenase [Candidatus Dormibacteraceae bacterium]